MHADNSHMNPHRTDILILLVGTLTAILILGLCIPRFANAATDEEMLAAAQPIASQAFEQPYCPTPRIELRADQKLDELTAYWGSRQSYGGYGFTASSVGDAPQPGYVNPATGVAFPDWATADATDCLILIRSAVSYELNQAEFCTILSHEYGHLAGWGHQSGDSLMNGDGILWYAPCYNGASVVRRPAFHREAPAPLPVEGSSKPTLYRQLVGDILSVLPRRFDWHARCKELRPRKNGWWGVCYMSAERAKTRRYVVLSIPFEWVRDELPAPRRKRGRR